MRFLKIPFSNLKFFFFFFFLYLTPLTRNSSSDNQLNNPLTDNTYYKSCIHVHKRQKRI